MKTKVLSTHVLLFALAQGAVAEGTARNFGGGDGSAKNPYLINSPDQWGKLSADVAAGDGYPIHGSPVRATRVFRAFSTPFVGTCSHGGLHPRLWSWQPFRLRNELANIFRVSDFLLPIGGSTFSGQVSAIGARDAAIFTLLLYPYFVCQMSIFDREKNRGGDRKKQASPTLSYIREPVAISRSKSQKYTCRRAEKPLPLRRENDSQTSFRCSDK